MTPRALRSPVFAMAGRKARPVHEARLVKDAAALVRAETGPSGSDPVGRQIARRVRDELAAFIAESDEPLLLTIRELLPQPSPFRTLAADPDIDTLALYVEARVARVRNRLGRSISPDQDRIECRDAMEEVEAKLTGRYIRLLRR